MRILAIPAALMTATPGFALDEGLTALARIDPQASRITDFGSDLHVELSLSQPVPWRVFTLDAPRRLVVDFSEVDFAGTDLNSIIASDGVSGILHGQYREGWSRLVLTLADPMTIETAGLRITETSSSAVIKISLAPASEQAFAAAVGAPDSGIFALPEAADTAQPIARQLGDRPLRIVIDPGHGGIDPGAEAGGLREADVILTAARELRAGLEAAGHDVTMTRDADIFVPLERRVSIARSSRADVFLSLHADALEEGTASGATIYTLSTTASDAASQKLAERHDRADLLAGVDLHDHDDSVALVLMEMARRETTPRSERLATKLVEHLARETGDLHKRPRLRAGFSVLKAPDIPSVLVELGFLSSEIDRNKLTDPEWRASAVRAMVAAVDDWAQEDADEARLLRQ